ncbi:immune inhibitor A domain-containing protein [Calditrichota bacterium GD2]
MKTYFLSLIISIIISSLVFAENDCLGKTMRLRPPIGQEPLLVLLIETQSFEPTYPPEEFHNIFFGNKPSVKNYFWEQSYQSFELIPAEESFSTINDGIIGWIKVSKAFDAYEDPYFIIKEAIQLSSDLGYIDYSNFDKNDPPGYISTDELHIYAIIAAYEGTVGDTSLSPRVVRRHYTTDQADIFVDSVYIGVHNKGGGISVAGEIMKISKNTIVATKVGPLAHELGHDLGLPDHYKDIDGDSFYESASAWCLQGTGDGDAIPKDENFNNLNFPNSICAPHRIQLGWVEPIVIKKDDNYSLNHIDNSIKGEAIKVWDNGNPQQEYFILENRYKQAMSDYDSFIPNSGLLIWHVDSMRIQKYCSLGVAIEDANNNGRIGESGDVFSSSTKSEFLQKATEPNSMSNDGSITGVAVYNISDAAQEMTMSIHVTHEPVRLDVAANPASIKADNTSITNVTAFLIDTWDDTVKTVTKTVSFRIISGEEYGVLVGPTEVESQNGAATTQLQSTLLSGAIQIEASSDGLVKDTVTVYTYNQVTEVDGYIKENTTWTLANSPYEVKGDIIITQGVVLTIEPGVVVKIRESADIVVQGGLWAEGTPYNHILFTAAGNQIPGAWGGIEFQRTTMDGSSKLEWCEFRYGGGVDLGYPVRLDLRANPVIRNVSISDCKINAIGLLGGYYNVNVRIDNPGLPLYPTGDIIIQQGATLNIEEGCLFKMPSWADFVIEGGLDAGGTESEPIVFTSYRDDARGGDSNGDGSSSAVVGDWGGIEFRSTTMDASSKLEWCEFYYGGGENLGYPILLDLRANPLIRNVSIADCKKNAVGLKGGYYNVDVRIDNPELPLYPTGDIIIQQGAVLTIEKGCLFKIPSWGDIIIEGGLDAGGTESEPVIFTSYRDDARGGDSNGDGSSSAVAGDWGGIEFKSTTMDAASKLEWCQFHYGGGENLGYPILLDLRANPLIRNVSIRACKKNAVGLKGGYYNVNVLIDNPSLPLWPTSDIVIQQGAILTIEKGCLFKMNYENDIIIQGGLNSVGTETEPIIFTSYKDDSRGGDVNNDGYSRGIAGDWGGIKFESSTMNTNTKLSYCQLYYSGSGIGYPIVCNNANPLIQNVIIDSTKSHGIYFYNNAQPDLGGGSRGSVGQNRFLGFVSDPNKYAIYNNGAANVFAQYNYWGTNIPSVISENIYDYYDNAAKGIVYYDPYNETGDFDPPSVTVISPNGGEKFHYGESQQIQWNATDQTGVYQIILYFSEDGGNSFTVIDTVSNSGRYNWIIPAVTSYYCRIKVAAIDIDNNMKYDISDNDFWITSFAPPDNEPPEMPKTIYPENGAEMKPKDYLVWTQSKDPNPNDDVSYHLQIDDDITFSDPEINYTDNFLNQKNKFVKEKNQDEKVLSNASISVLLTELSGYEYLKDDQLYYWRVQAVDNFGETSSFTDSTRCFFFNKMNTAPFAVNAGFSPAEGDTVIDLSPEISWYHAVDPDLSDNESNLKYILQISDDDFYSGYDYEYDTPTGYSSVFITDTLKDDSFWYYRIKTIDDEGGESPWSATQRFYTYLPEPPSSFKLLHPTNQDTIDSLKVYLDWEDSSDPIKGIGYYSA